MIDIAVRELEKEYEIGQPILDGLTFQVDTGERVGILGRNGAGKTTLFRILTGQEEADGGQVQIAPGKRLGLISQIPVYPQGFTVEDVLRTAFDDLKAMEEELHQLSDQLAGGDKELLSRYDRLQVAFESGGGYEIETRMEKICAGLGIEKAFREKQFADLSGGEKTRINLARLILVDTEILLLDEPTNHLDLNATVWLEDYISHYKGTVLIISHDRYFLDKTISRVIELKNGKAEFYTGNYSFYAVEKERRYLEQLRQYKKEQAELQRLSDTVRMMHEHNTEHLHKRAFSIEKRMAKLNGTARPVKERKLQARFGQAEFHADDLLSLNDLGKAFGEQTLFTGVTARVEDGDRIALLGDNGTGKSTLLKIILGEESQDQGSVKQGITVKVGYLPQQIRFSHPERTLYDTMIYEANCTPQQARDRLARFLFQGEDVFKPVSVLSGGEQSRLRLCMLMDEKVNLLILDEPTNHLDLDSREWIESAVEDYEGTLLFVSHDRYFIDRFATRVWTLENGKISDFRGDYTAYQAMRERQKSLTPPPKKEEKPKKEKPKRSGGTKQLKKELAAAEKRMEKLDELLEELEAEKEAAATDYQKLQELLEQEGAYREEYDRLMETWESLSEAIEAENNP
ncbi:MAG: ABC-F family ATP-binding cassette domain-containing protein [Evtepia sp.]|uniref:ABC-F family ATP-binding cassette domain-containing protein n=1 Tax=Evtepia sp. TaxID=2773933 RepID=UPI002A752D12|nr:ABC-F family ATP-binding cassette domain-containing protein [Evtepia sp.]MDY3014092.1 ABC-F family ATP-binding cassette domain-containing protein [Evtepia sp.]